MSLAAGGLSATQTMSLAAGIMVFSYALIFSERIHRASAALLGAILMVLAGSWFGFYDQVQALQAIDANTLLLLMAMMLLVAMLRPTGAFEYIGIRLAKLAGGVPSRLLIYLTVAVSILSMFLDNVTTVIVFAPLTVLVTRVLDLNPAPFLIAEAMMSNLGGTTTLIGDPPNIMIGSAGNIDFASFLLHLGPLVLPAWFISLGLLLFVFRKQLQPIDPSATTDLDERKAIRDPVQLRRVSFALGLVVVLFFVHHHLHFYPALVSLIGLSLALLLVRPDLETLMGKVEWSLLLFFASLFVLVGGVEASGLLSLIGDSIAEHARDPQRLLFTALALMWAAAIISALVDNIPFTLTMLPIITSLQAQGADVQPLWWALAIGVGLGGNGTHIGATANLICVAEAERSGHPEARISPGQWLRVGIPTMLLSLIAASLVYALWFKLIR